jgi:hypothetical protein
MKVYHEAPQNGSLFILWSSCGAVQEKERGCGSSNDTHSPRVGEKASHYVPRLDQREKKRSVLPNLYHRTKSKLPLFFIKIIKN